MDQLITLGDVLLRSVLSIVALFFLTRLMGKKQISQLTLFDYIIGISIGSIAAEMSFASDVPYTSSLLAMAVYALFSILLSFATNKSIRIRRFINGAPVLLVDKGKIIEENMKKVKYDLNELLSECRNNGYFNLADIEYVIMETDGRLSFLTKTNKRPVVPEDLGLSLPQETLLANVIIDGHIMENNLRAIGKSTPWLKTQLQRQQLGHRVKDILLATADQNNTLTLFLKHEPPRRYNYFE